MKQLFSIARPVSGYGRGTHSNQECVIFRVWNDGIIGVKQAPAI